MLSEEFFTTLMKLLVAVVGLASAGLESYKEKKPDDRAGRRRGMPVVIICFVVLIGMEAYSFSRDFLNRSLRLHDPIVFSPGSTGKAYRVAIVYPDRAALIGDQTLRSVFENTKRDFDIETTSWHKQVAEYTSDIEKMLARKVEMRVLLFDARDSNQDNCKAFAATLKRTCADLEQHLSEALTKLREIQAKVPDGYLEVKLYRTMPLKSFWIKDRKNPDESIVQLQVLDDRDDKRISFRVGRLDPDNDLEQNLDAQFEVQWQDQQTESVPLRSNTNTEASHR